MNTSVYIARRYLFSRKSTHAINIISGISTLGVFVGSAALIIILSGFNGMEDIIVKMYNNFTPQLKIEPKQGKTFNPNTTYFNTLHKNKALVSFTEVLEEHALVKYGDRQVISTLKGVSDEFLNNKALDSTLDGGAFVLKKDKQPFAVVGSIVQGNLSVNVKDSFTPLQIFTPSRAKSGSVIPIDEFKSRFIYPSGSFTMQRDFDDRVITPLDFARDLLDQPVNISAIELNFKPGTDIDAIQHEIKDNINTQFTVHNRSEQNTLLYKILHLEKASTFLILAFILIIAIFNIVGSLTMLVMDKQKDIAILASLGAAGRVIQGIFFVEGMLITLSGCIAGMVVGFIFSILQKYFGMIKMDVDMPFPVQFRITDFLLVFLTVTVIGSIASAISARISVKGLDEIKQDL
ncbi:ABC transporter permease [Mucilaginibacter sp. HMF5004]|uniref:FtsX-like permease family protein n=1 Tax=Mucilaginibacter rivuli TaxID=2857527 RepID=UPI001C5DC1CE|nr:FtsX-like permease family protein [Mucilaginibacter rivuli]MBW4888589.1 ABC transporter permease [Mucilaginibacter rivuli]